jgi:branched-chain amino acid transport system permease protein
VSLVVQVIVTGLAAGGVYGIFAVGYSLIYRLTGVVYFAFGDLVAFGVFTTLLVAAGTGPVSQTSLGLGRFLFALAVGLVLCIGVGAATYVLFIEPYLLRGSTVGWVASTLAIAFALRGMIGAVFTRPAYVFPDPFHFENVGRNGVVSIAGASVQVRSFFVIGLAAALTTLTAWTLERTRRGAGATGDLVRS